jgi:hypothetical protein
MEEQNDLLNSNINKFLDYLDDPADLEKASMHGRCQKAYKIMSPELEGIFVNQY